MSVYISILIPIYGVEKYIEKCAESLFNQTLDRNIEYIFVNDCTPDSSINILKDTLTRFPNRINQVKIINHKINKGVGHARLTAIDNAAGEYIAFCDGDDWVQPDMYEKLLIRASENNDDISGCDFFVEGGRGQKRIQFCYQNKTSFLRDVIGNRWGTLWKYIIRRSLVETVRHHFNADINHGEDYIMSSLFLLNANSYSHVNECLYHYNCLNVSSLMHNVTKVAAEEQMRASEIVFSTLKDMGISDQYKDEIFVRKIFTRLQMLMAGERISDVYPEVKSNLWGNNRISFKKKILLSLIEIMPSNITGTILKKLY